MKPRRRNSPSQQRSQKPAQKQSDDSVGELVQRGASAMLAERPAQAELEFRAATQADWRHLGARTGLGLALAAMGRLGEASDELQRAAEIRRKDAVALCEIGRLFEKIGEYARAQRTYQRAAAIAELDPRPLALAASAAEHALRLEEAEELCQQALARDAKSPEAMLIRSRILRRREHLDTAEALLSDAIASAVQADPVVRSRLHYERAAVRDRTGQYALAVEDLRNAKSALVREGSRWLKPGQEALYMMRRFVQELSAERVDRWTSESSGLSTAKVVAMVGFPRSGTTLLEQVLDAHPMIASVEETSYWSSLVVSGIYRSQGGYESLAQALDQVDRATLLQVREAYLSAMRAHVGSDRAGHLLLDKNPMRTLMVPMLRRAIPSTPVIVALRDPRDVVLSNLMQPYEISAMNEAFLDVARGGAFYEIIMNGWLKLRELLDGLVEVRYEDFVGDVRAAVTPTIKLLGLEWTDALDRFQEVSRNRVVRSPTYADVRESVHTRAVRRWEHYADYLAPALPGLNRIAAALGYEA